MSMRKFYLSGAAAIMCLSAASEGSGGAGDDRLSKIRAALGKSDTTEDTHWTNAGLPSMERMKAITGLEDLTREEVSKASPGYSRTNANAAPSDLGNSGGGDAGPTKTEAETLADQMKENIKPNSDPRENPNVGKDYLNSAEGQAHTADQQQLIEAAAQAETATAARSMPNAAEIAEAIKDPILLIEAATAAMNADDRFRKNGELQNFLRGYQIAQLNIRAHQERLNKRYETVAG